MQNFATNLFEMTNDSEQDMLAIENALYSVRSSFSGPLAPSAEPGQLWYDTTGSLLRHRGASGQWRGIIAFRDQTEANITRMWVYASAQEEGFTEDTANGDRVLALRGGYQDYSVWGKRGQWNLDDITIPNHSSHSHTLQNVGSPSTAGTYGGYGVAKDTIVGQNLITRSGTVGSSLYTAGYTTDGPDPTITHSTGSSLGTWRPQAAVGIMIYPIKIP